MSCTDAVSWRRWASKIQIPTASHSGREGESGHAVNAYPLCAWSVNTHSFSTQNPKPQRYSSVNSRESLYCLETIHDLFFCIFTLSVFSSLLCSLQETYEAKRKEFLGDLQRKEEEMRQMFVNKVKETEAELKEKEREVSVGKWRLNI